MNTTFTVLLFNILEAALLLAHQFAHRFFDCNSYDKYTVLRGFDFLNFNEQR